MLEKMSIISSRGESDETSSRCGSSSTDNYETMPLDLEIMLTACRCNTHTDLIWDPFPSCNGFSIRYIERLGYRVYKPPAGESVDFFAYESPPAGVTFIVSNVPFSQKQTILQRLVRFALPFCILLPSDVLQRDYFTDVVRQSATNQIENGDRRRWSVLMPNKTLKFHQQGHVQPLARFKSAFFIYKVEEEEEEEEEDDAMALPVLDSGDVLANVRINVFDYATMLGTRERAGAAGVGVACKEIHTTGPHIGKRKR